MSEAEMLAADMVVAMRHCHSRTPTIGLALAPRWAKLGRDSFAENVRFTAVCTDCSGGGRVANPGTQNASRRITCTACHGNGRFEIDRLRRPWPPRIRQALPTDGPALARVSAELWPDLRDDRVGIEALVERMLGWV